MIGLRRVGIGVLILVLVAVGGTGSVGAQAPKPEGEMRWALYVSLVPAWFDPGDVVGVLTPFWVLYAMHDALVKPMPGNHLTPSLAESWTLSPDQRTYEFKLREGLKFHNGDPFTSEDVRFSFHRAKGSKVLQEKVRDVEIAGPYRVRFHLHEPWPDFMTFYGTVVSGAGWIVPKKYVEQVGDVRLAALDHGQPRRRLQHALEHQALDARHLAPVPLVGFHHELDARLLADELVGPETDRMLQEAVLADLLDVLLGHDPGGAGGEGAVEGHEVGPRLVQVEAHARGADDLHVLHLLVEQLAPGAREAELDVLGRERLAVVELDSLAQLELVRALVGADRPRLGQARRVVVAGHRLHHRVVQRIEDPEGRERAGHLAGIVPGRHQRDVDGEAHLALGLGLGGRPGHAAGDDEGAREQEGGDGTSRGLAHGSHFLRRHCGTAKRGGMVAWRAMQEVHPTRQVPGEAHRRWFSSGDLDLIVWCDHHGAPVAFQLCYDKGRSERALTWEPTTGLVHSAVDDGEFEIGMRYKATPVLAPDGPLDVPRVAARFAAASTDLPTDIAAFVRDRLRD